MVLHHHSEELVKVDGAVPVGVGVAEHLVALCGGERLPVARHGLAQLLLRDAPVVVAVEGPAKNILIISWLVA